MVRVGYRYSPSPTHPVPTTPGTPSHDARCRYEQCRGQSPAVNMVVGLKSVVQLSLYAHFSGFQLMTEVYNLATAGNPNDQKYILGTE